jgi:hypothetical protein
VALAAKCALLLLPALAAAQWALRCAQLVRRLKREAGRTKPRKLRSGEPVVPVLRRRLVLSLINLCCVGTLVGFFAFSYELNGVNSSFGNFLIVALVGCLFESLLSTYEVRGRLRNVVFFGLFMCL